MKTIAPQFELPGMPAPVPVVVVQQHHKQGMSALNYLAACAGFENRNTTSEAAEDGNRLHDIMERVVANIIAYPVAPGVADPAMFALLDLMETLKVTEEEEFYLRFCCKELDYWLAKKPLSIHTEARVHIRHEDGSILNYGHYDLLIRLTAGTAILFDYKFGWIRVPAAAQNWQGKGYATGVFQETFDITKLGVVFIQPKLHLVTRCSYNRADLHEMYRGVRTVVENAQAEHKTLRPGPYCDYCAAAPVCKALLNDAQRALSIHEGMPMPASFVGLKINTPEEAAHALYVLDRLEVLIEESGLKEKAKEFARLNDGKISCTLPNGQTITAELKQRNSPRSLNSPALIADCLKDVLTPEQVLSACDPKISRLEPIFADALVAQADADAKAILEAAQAASLVDPAQAKAILKAAKEEAKTVRITKKRAAEILSDTLMSEGLLSPGDGKVEYLKVRVETQTKPIV
jgi:hypothetical protein